VLGEVSWAAEIAPIVFFGAEGEDVFAWAASGGRRDDGEDAFFGEHREEAGRDDVNAGETEGLETN